MTRLPRILLSTLTAAGLAAAVAPAAHAADRTFCIDVPQCPAGAQDFGKLSLQSALNLAGANAGRDRILLGPGDGTPYVGPFTYDHSGADNTVSIEGYGGRPLLTSTTSGSPVLRFVNGEPALKHLDVRVPTLKDVDGFVAEQGSIDDTRILGVGDGSSQAGLKLTHHGTIANSTVSVANGLALSGANGEYDIDRSHLGGSVGILANDANVFLTKSTVDAANAGITVIRQLDGTPPYGLRLQATRVTTSSPTASAVFTRDSLVELERTTIASRSPQPSTGTAVKVEAQDHDPFIGLDSSLVAGYAHPFVRDAAAGHTVDADFGHSQFDHAGDQLGGPAQGTVSEDHVLGGEPALVNRTGGDVHLRAGSPAIDLGALSAPTTYDLDGALPIDGNGDGTTIPDAGAYEFKPTPKTPAGTTPPPVGQPVPPTPKPKPTPKPTPTPKRTAKDTKAPSLSRLKLSPPKLRARSAKKLRLRIKASERATVRVTITRRATKGHKARTLKRSIVLHLNKGTASRKLGAALKKAGALKPGRYVLKLRARDAAGNRAMARTLRLTVRR